MRVAPLLTSIPHAGASRCDRQLHPRSVMRVLCTAYMLCVSKTRGAFGSLRRKDSPDDHRCMAEQSQDRRTATQHSPRSERRLRCFVYSCTVCTHRAQYTSATLLHVMQYIKILCVTFHYTFVHCIARGTNITPKKTPQRGILCLNDRCHRWVGVVRDTSPNELKPIVMQEEG